MKKYLLILTVFVISFKGKADFCIPSLEKDFEQCEVIFIGKVIDESYNELWSWSNSRKITGFQIITSYKGLYTSMCSNCTNNLNYISILDSYSSSTIGYEMDSTYLVFAYAADPYKTIFWTNDCTNTELLSKSDSIKLLVEKHFGKGFNHPNEFTGDIKKKLELDKKEIDKALEPLLNSISHKESTIKILYLVILIVILISIIFFIMTLRKKKK